MKPKNSYSPIPSILKITGNFSFLAICLLLTGAATSAQTAAKSGSQLTASALPNSGGLRSNYAEATTVSVAVATLAEASAIEKRAFELTNSVRAENGRSPLTWDADLCQLARSYSEKMARLGFFAHIEPDGSDLRDRVRGAGIRYRAIGENIAYNHGIDDPGASTVERWMNSSGHRNNLLGKEYRASAVGVFVSPQGRVYITQLFITR
jgi:uncharacterized protein YkwD